MTAIVWFRRDLRLHDNPALSVACREHTQVLPVFCVDDRLTNGRNRSFARIRFLLGCLQTLSDDLEAFGSRLLVVAEKPEIALPRLAKQSDAETVFAADDVSPFARTRDSFVSSGLADSDCTLQLMPGTFVVDDLSAVRTGAGSPYNVFTPFYRRWLHAGRRDPLPSPTHIPAFPKDLHAERGADLADLIGHADAENRSAAEATGLDPSDFDMWWEPGEHAAREMVRTFLNADVEHYAERHDALSVAGTSRVSPYLHLGCISPRELEASLNHDDGPDALRRQLCWRDFYAHVLLFNPGNAQAEHQERFRDQIRWSNSEANFEAWRRGMTGYPMVDAAMRQLATTGWMHNRARMVAGSFLVKDLAIDWRRGEQWFMETLLDGDEANNNGNWQWIASVGVDPQPVSRRIYNPTLQQQRFDPDGHYVRAHVEELRKVPDDFLAEPWTMPEDLQRQIGCVIGEDYPEPIVEHAAARRETIERYREARSASDTQ